MKKLLFLIGLLAVPAFANGPLYSHKDPADSLEFDNVYQNILSLSALTSSLSIDTNKRAAMKGTTANDNANSGYIGEYIESKVTSANAVGASGDQAWFNVTSISLTAGDWDVTGQIIFTINGATYKAVGSAVAVSAFSGNTTTDHIAGDNTMPWGTNPTAGFDQGGVVSHRFSLAATTTIYLKAWTGFSAGTPKAYGKIMARRMR